MIIGNTDGSPGAFPLDGYISLAATLDIELTDDQAELLSRDPRNVLYQVLDGVTGQHPLAGSITRMYAMSEGTGTNVADLSGNGFDGTLDATADWTVLGDEQSVDVADSSTADINCGTSPFAADSPGGFVLRYNDRGTAANGLFVSDGKLNLKISGTPNQLRFGLDGAFVASYADTHTANDWHTVVFTWDAAGEINSWRDGSHDANFDPATGGGAPAAPTQSLILGNDNSGSLPQVGGIAFFASFNVELTAAQGKSLSLNPYQLLYGTEQAARIAGSTWDITKDDDDVLKHDATPIRGGALIDAGAAVSGISDTTHHIGAKDQGSPSTNVARVAARQHIRTAAGRGIQDNQSHDELAWMADD